MMDPIEMSFIKAKSQRKRRLAMDEKHEDEVCNTVVDFIVKRKNLTINRISCPDKEKKNNVPSVDRLIECRGVEIVLEHTLIESYPEQIADSKRVTKLLGPLRTELTGQFPSPGHYKLSIDVGAVKGAKDTEYIQNALIKWIKEKAPLLRVGSPNVAPNHYIREEPPEVPFEVTLYRFARRDGELRSMLDAPEDLREKRRERIRKALEEKCPKLHKARGDNRISVLLLEWDDIFLGDDLEIAHVVTGELAVRNDVPDEIYLVDTSIITQWAVLVVKDGTSLFRDIDDPEPYYLKPKDTSPKIGDKHYR